MSNFFALISRTAGVKGSARIRDVPWSPDLLRNAKLFASLPRSGFWGSEVVSSRSFGSRKEGKFARFRITGESNEGEGVHRACAYRGSGTYLCRSAVYRALLRCAMELWKSAELQQLCTV